MDDPAGGGRGRAVPLQPKGAAIEVRIYAEMPHAGFKPATGRLTEVVSPPDARVEAWVATGTDRADATARLQVALAGARLSGIGTNLAYLRAIAGSELWASGKVATTAIQDFTYAPDLIAVLITGPQSSAQELPGRLGLWQVGVPPSGPMDARSFAQANRMVGNADETAALKLTGSGTTLRCYSDAVVDLAGAATPMRLDGVAVFGVVAVRAGQVLSVGAPVGPRKRAYLSVAGGFVGRQMFGSRPNFNLGQFGGHTTGFFEGGRCAAFTAGRAGWGGHGGTCGIGVGLAVIAGLRAAWRAGFDGCKRYR